MMLSDLGAGIASAATLVLYSAGHLEPWHLYALGAWIGAFNVFQFPAYSAAISTMVPKAQYARANGMLALAESASGIAAPILAGLLLTMVGLGGILVLDIVSFAFGTLLIVVIPQPGISHEGHRNKSNLSQESIYGFRYILQRPALLCLQCLLFVSNLIAGAGAVLLVPMILARTGNNQLVLAGVQSAFGVGGVLGGIVMTVWGGPRQRIQGILISLVGSSCFGYILMEIGQAHTVWLVAAFFIIFFVPILNGSNQAIWQTKVAPDVQGKVFAARRVIGQISMPVAMLVIGPLVDTIFEPSMMPGGSLATTFGSFVGTGPGAGMALMFALLGCVGVLAGIGGYCLPLVRRIEQVLPDYGDYTDMLAATGNSDHAWIGVARMRSIGKTLRRASQGARINCAVVARTRCPAL